MGVLFAILGGILKWILLIILGLIGLILVLLLIVMLTPLRYKIKWAKQADAMGGEARVSWLLHLISFRLTQSGKEVKWTLKIGPKIIAASDPLPKNEKKPKKPKKRKKKTPPQEPILPEGKPPEAEKTENILQEEAAPVMLPEPPVEPIAADEGLQKEEIREEFPAAPEEVLVPDEEAEAQKQTVKKSLRRRITDVCWKIRRFFEKIVDTLRGIRDKIRAIPVKIRGLLDKWDQVKAIWEGYPQKEETVNAIKQMLGGIVKAPLPKKYDVQLRIGMKDPATTGQILMYYYALTPVLFPKTTRRRRFVLEAEFEEPVLDVTAVCKGHFSLGSFIWPVIRALLNAHIRRLIRYVLSIKKNSSQKEI